MAQRGRGAAAGARAVSATPAPVATVPVEKVRARVRSLVTPIVAEAGLDLEDVSVSRAGRRYVVRVIVDGDGGVSHDDLSDVSRDISDGLDAAEESGGDLTPDAYTLEVSSPGVDRPLTQARHWRRNVGRLVKVKAGDRQLTARIVAVTDTAVSLEADGRSTEVAFADLGPGHIQLEFTRLESLTDEDFDELASREGIGGEAVEDGDGEEDGA